jgi:eukaryotic-like serine/threonine-protein kinase
MANPEEFTYRAFLSYAHADKSWARWLHRRLESYPLGKTVRAR